MISNKEVQDKLLESRKALKRFLNTEEGILVAEILEQGYVKGSVLSDSSEMTHYKLGQKELIQDILAHKDLDIDTLYTTTGE